MVNKTDFASELIIKPFRAGVQLICPEQACGMRLGATNDLPFAHYFMSPSSRNLNTNEACADLCAASSPRRLIGLDAYDLWDKTSASKSQANDKHVMNSESLLITDDSGTRMNDSSYVQMITFKMPWYAEEKVAGVYGITLKFNPLALGEFTSQLTTLMAAGLLKSEQMANLPLPHETKEENIYLSKREIDILRLLVQNMTAKQIAERLHLSKRTVENYLVNIKIKTNCDSKFALIEKFYWKLKSKN